MNQKKQHKTKIQEKEFYLLTDTLLENNIQNLTAPSCCMQSFHIHIGIVEINFF